MRKTVGLSLWLLSVMLGSVGNALATCAPMDVATWTADQRQYLEDTIATTLGEEVMVRWVPGSVGETVQVCARTADAGTLNSASLQAQAQSLFDAQQAIDTAKGTEKTEILTELETSPICRTATLAQINARIDAELDTQKAAIQVDIDAATNIATAKVAMTSMNNRLTATVRQTTKQLAKCMVGYMRLQQ